VDPLADSTWSTPDTVAGFARSLPNPVLMQFAETERRRRGDGSWALDLGCGAGRNAIPLARLGWTVLGIDLSWPMLDAAAERLREEPVGGRLHLALAAMDTLPVHDRHVDLLVAHGIWNLARSAAQFRRALSEASRVARPGAGLFVFTFSRTTLLPQAEPLPGEPFVFTQFSGQPQCFLTADQLLRELDAAGFTPDPGVPLEEHNRPRPGTLQTGTAPVIYQGAFRYIG
jgi:SAM-dependent methyltransferase